MAYIPPQLKQQIEAYVLDMLSDGAMPLLAKVVAGEFKISKGTANRVLLELERSQKIQRIGNSQFHIHGLVSLGGRDCIYPTKGLEEHVVWKNDIAPVLAGVRPNVLSICQYGLTEMVNNAIDHSESEHVVVSVVYTPSKIAFSITDMGVGIFRKIRRAFDLPDDVDAIHQLVKGKLTTDKVNHTGEGIFFSSRAFDRFQVLSYSLFYSCGSGAEWVVNEDDNDPTEGTVVTMSISPRSETVLKDIIHTYSDFDEYPTFTKTHVPVSMMKFGDGGNLISRSQAKRLVCGFERFKVVLLDFNGVDEVGQGFSDEVFRVYANAHPDIDIRPINANSDVKVMIDRAIAQRKAENLAPRD